MNITSSSSKTWLLDLGLFISFIVTFWLDLTGVSLHEWLGIIIGNIAIGYLILRWKSVESFSDQLRNDSSRRRRLTHWINTIILIGVFLISLTGLVISTWLKLKIHDYVLFYYLHVLVSIITLLTVVLKIGLSWRGIVQVIKNWIASQIKPKSTELTTLSDLNPDLMGRREFISLMALVGAGCVFAIIKAFQGVETAAKHAIQINKGLTKTQPGSAGGRASDACTIRCPGHCIYQRKCARWMDTDGDRHCDQGECF